MEKDSKELSYISNMNFELQNSVDWLNNRLDTTAERTEEIMRQIWKIHKKEKNAAPLKVEKRIKALENRIRTHIHLFGINRGKNKEMKRTDIQRIDGFEFFWLSGRRASSIQEAQ